MKELLLLEELDDSRYNVMPSSSELAVEIVNGSFAWDSLNTDRTFYVDRLKAAACRRRSRNSVGKSSEVKPPQRGNDDGAAADKDDKGDVSPDPVALLYEAVFARDDSPDVLFAVNFTVAKVT